METVWVVAVNLLAYIVVAAFFRFIILAFDFGGTSKDPMNEIGGQPEWPSFSFAEWYRMLRQITGKHDWWLLTVGTANMAQRTLDKAHPRSLEILAYRAELQGLKDGVGVEADTARARIQAALTDLYKTNLLQRQIDSEDYAIFVRPRLDQLDALRRETDRAFFETRRQSLSAQNFIPS